MTAPRVDLFNPDVRLRVSIAERGLTIPVAVIFRIAVSAAEAAPAIEIAAMGGRHGVTLMAFTGVILKASPIVIATRMNGRASKSGQTEHQKQPNFQQVLQNGTGLPIIAIFPDSVVQ